MGFKNYILPLATSFSLINMLVLDAANYEDMKEIASNEDNGEIARAERRGGAKAKSGAKSGGGPEAGSKRAAVGGGTRGLQR
ncbi:MAG TPA: hypothetical protein VGP47_08965 [Parachlamydiaceae bacterium]|nr:hypothetical protein [Parachlamydiaceae bacterium]